MRPPVPRFVPWAVALAVLVTLTAAVFQYWGSSQYGTASADNAGWTQTQWGPLGPADRDLLVMVWQAGQYGGSSGQQAQRPGSSAGVRAIAQRTGVDYGNLDDQVRSVAAQLGVALPDQPTAQQQGWMKELAGRSGPGFDRMFAQRLRSTDGEVLPAITNVRVGTRNGLIRSFATNAAMLVNRHMAYLEASHLLDLPPAGTDQHIDQVVHATPAPSSSPSAGNDANAVVASLVLIAALLVGLGLLGTTGRRVRRAGARPQRRGGPQPGVPARPPQSRHTASRHAAQRW